MNLTISGAIRQWKLGEHNRIFGEVCLPYEKASLIFQTAVYNAISNKGEQREVCVKHCRKIRNAIDAGDFTPTPIAVGLRKNHRDGLTTEDNIFSLVVSSDAPLPMTDGGHRMEAIKILIEETRGLLSEASDDEKESLEKRIAQLNQLPIVAMIHIDGEPQRDFINLQLGKTVDKAHMLSLQAQRKILDNPAFKLAFGIAKLLHKQEDSPFHNQIRFDSRGIMPLPLSSLCSFGSSDNATSLIGLARIGLALNEEVEAKYLAYAIISAYKALRSECPSLLDYGKPLTTLANGGKKGSATILVGVGMLLAYRTMVRKEEIPHETSLKRLVNSAKLVFDESVSKLEGAVKRRLLGDFARDFLGDLEGEKHEGIPVSLLTTIVPSALGASSLPKKPKGRKKKAAALPKEDSPILADKKPLKDLRYESENEFDPNAEEESFTLANEYESSVAEGEF